MSLDTPRTWDTIVGPIGSTTSSFGGNWGNLISNYFNGVNIALVDPTKAPNINTFTRYRYEKFALFDFDASHYITFTVDDIDTGINRKIKFRRMNSPNEEDYAVLENLPQTLSNKTIPLTSNTISEIANANIASNAAIAYSKLNLSGAILAGDIASNAISTAKIADGNVTLAKLASNSVDGTKIAAGSVSNSHVNSAAAIAYSKLNLGTSIVNGDIATAAGIVYSKLSLTGGIVNTDINASAAIAYSKLSLTGGIVNADINASAAIAKSKLAALAIADVDVSGSAAIAYSKLNLAGAIVNADISTSAAIADSKLAQITNKAKLPSAILYNDVDNNFGAHYFDVTRITIPADPSANNARFYVKQVDTNNDGVFVKIKKNAGFVEVQVV